MTNIEEIYAAMSADELASFKAASAQHHDQSTPEFLAATKALVLLQDRLGEVHPEVTAEAIRTFERWLKHIGLTRSQIAASIAHMKKELSNDK